MVFHVRWIFLSTSLRIPPESLATRVGLGDKWWEIHLTWETIPNEIFRILYTSRYICLIDLVMLNTLRKVEDHENHVRWIYLTTVLYMGESQKYAINHEYWSMLPWARWPHISHLYGSPKGITVCFVWSLFSDWQNLTEICETIYIHTSGYTTVRLYEWNDINVAWHSQTVTLMLHNITIE